MLYNAQGNGRNFLMLWIWGCENWLTLMVTQLYIIANYWKSIQYFIWFSFGTIRIVVELASTSSIRTCLVLCMTCLLSPLRQPWCILFVTSLCLHPCLTSRSYSHTISIYSVLWARKRREWLLVSYHLEIFWLKLTPVVTIFILTYPNMLGTDAE